MDILLSVTECVLSFWLHEKCEAAHDLSLLEKSATLYFMGPSFLNNFPEVSWKKTDLTQITGKSETLNILNNIC